MVAYQKESNNGLTTTAPNRPVLLIVMDGWGMGSGGTGDAIAHAHTPTFDHLWNHFAHTTLMTHGTYVGLPASKDMGGSEVGHLTMGAGMILDQGPTRINKAIEDGSFYHSEVLQQLIQSAQKGGTLHLVGLLSDGNIHSHIDYFITVIRYAFTQKVHKLRIHALLDGRDVAIQSAETYVAMIEAEFEKINQVTGFDYAFHYAGGRERVVMDRDRDWGKVALGWQAMVHGACAHTFASVTDGINFFRAQTEGLVDQDLPGFLIQNRSCQTNGNIVNGDAVLMMNFRGDRAIELTEAFCLDDFDGFDRGSRPDVCYAGMMVYDEDRNLPPLQVMGTTKVERPLGRQLVELGMKQFRLAETQKYAHVTFFFNGGYRQPLDSSLEDYVLIPSDRGIEFLDAPAMKAVEVADKAIELIHSGEYDFGLINFANADMVGHCGSMDAAVAAVEAVDIAVGRIVNALQEVGGMALITADHGNAEEMTIEKGGQLERSTKHSINPVPCILFDPHFDGSYQLRQPQAKDSVTQCPGLSHIAATILEMLHLQAAKNMAPSLIEKNSSKSC
ncbi:MAG: 2,3-bisphosphoglycerate-independent phosphoglycerate mutase [Zetaproteobacteria bacterium]|nr:2,3-bisphosphoglycerate-independent phosphoglycerate mutase [Zetaproteobacteria bacterium]